MKRALVIGVGGCSGSGKTTLARELARELNGIHFQMDHYYRDLGHLSYEERRVQNFDDPSLIESDLLVDQLRQLASGKPIEQPRYDFATHTRRPGVFERIEPSACVVVDGIFALHFPGLRELYDLSVYVEAPDEVCYARRMARDVRERGRTEASVAQHYAATVRPMAEKYVRPSGQFAMLTVRGTESLDWSVEAVLGALRQREGHGDGHPVSPQHI
ncbi:MAG: uridine kinase [Acidobacteria bacterium]|nr:uridine kinase [Acidobacteriota bacterium]